MALPVLGVRRDDGVGGDDGEAEPARGGEDGVALLAGAELGVEVARAAQAEDALEEGGIAGEQDEPLTVVGEGAGQAIGAVIPSESVIPSEARDLGRVRTDAAVRNVRVDPSLRSG